MRRSFHAVLFSILALTAVFLNIQGTSAQSPANGVDIVVMLETSVRYKASNAADNDLALRLDTLEGLSDTLIRDALYHNPGDQHRLSVITFDSEHGAQVIVPLDGATGTFGPYTNNAGLLPSGAPQRGFDQRNAFRQQLVENVQSSRLGAAHPDEALYQAAVNKVGAELQRATLPGSNRKQVVIVIAAGVPHTSRPDVSVSNILQKFDAFMANRALRVIMLPIDESKEIGFNSSNFPRVWESNSMNLSKVSLAGIGGTENDPRSLIQVLNDMAREFIRREANADLVQSIPVNDERSATFTLPAFVAGATFTLYGDAPEVEPAASNTTGYRSTGVTVVTYENPSPTQQIRLSNVRLAEVRLRMGSGHLTVAPRANRWINQPITYEVRDLYGRIMDYPGVIGTATLTINADKRIINSSGATGRFEYPFMPLDAGEYRTSIVANTGDDAIRVEASASTFAASDPAGTVTVPGPDTMYVASTIQVSFPSGAYPVNGLSQPPFNLRLCARLTPVNAPDKTVFRSFDDRAALDGEGMTYTLSEPFFPQVEGQYNIEVSVRSVCDANHDSVSQAPLATGTLNAHQLYMDFLQQPDAVQFKSFSGKIGFFYKGDNNQPVDVTTKLAQVPIITFSGGADVVFTRTDDGYQAEFPALNQSGNVPLEIGGGSGVLWLDENGPQATINVKPAGLNINLLPAGELKQFEPATIRVTLTGVDGVSARMVSDGGVAARASFLIEGVDNAILNPIDLTPSTDGSTWEAPVFLPLGGDTRIRVDLFERRDPATNIGRGTADPVTVAPVNFTSAPPPAQPVYAPTTVNLAADTQADANAIFAARGLRMCAQISHGKDSELVGLVGVGNTFTLTGYAPDAPDSYAITFSLRRACDSDESAITVPTSPVTFTASPVYLAFVGEGNTPIIPSLRQNLSESKRVGWFFKQGNTPALYEGALQLAEPLSYSYMLDGKEITNTLPNSGGIITFPPVPRTAAFPFRLTAAGTEPIPFYPDLRGVRDNSIPIEIIPLYLGIVNPDPNVTTPFTPTLEQFNPATYEVGYFYARGDSPQRFDGLFSSAPQVKLSEDVTNARLQPVKENQRYPLAFLPPMRHDAIAIKLDGTLPGTNVSLPFWSGGTAADNRFNLTVRPANMDIQINAADAVQFGSANLTVMLNSGAYKTAANIMNLGLHGVALITLPGQQTPQEIPLTTDGQGNLVPEGPLSLPLGGTYGVRVEIRDADGTVLARELDGGYSVEAINLKPITLPIQGEVDQRLEFAYEWQRDGHPVSPSLFINKPTVKYQFLREGQTPAASTPNPIPLEANAEGRYSFDWQTPDTGDYDLVMSWEAPSLVGERYAGALPPDAVAIGAIVRIKLLLDDQLPDNQQGTSQQRYYEQYLPFFLNFVPLFDPGVRRGANFSFDIVLAEDNNRDGQISANETARHPFAAVYGSQAKPEDVFELVVSRPDSAPVDRSSYHVEYLPNVGTNSYTVNISGLPQNEEFKFALSPKVDRGEGNYRIDRSSPDTRKAMLVQSHWMFTLPLIIYGGLLLGLTIWVVGSSRTIERAQRAEPHLCGYLRLEDEAGNLLGGWEQNLNVRERNTVVFPRGRRWPLLGVNRLKAKHLDEKNEAVEVTLWHDNQNIVQRLRYVIAELGKQGIRAITPYRLGELWAGKPEVITITRDSQGERLTQGAHVVGYLKYSHMTHEQDSRGG